MAEINDPQYLQGGSHTAQGDRQLIKSLVAQQGVVGASALAVTEKSGTPNMSVDVASGSIFIAGQLGSMPGTYHMTNDATKNLAIAAADSTNPRKDLVVARVYDSFYSGATDDWALEVVTGTPAASPAEPTVPDNAYVLALVDVAASVSSITNANITDRRKESSSPTGLRAIVKFTASGSFTKANYPWLRAVRVRLVGGGGGGVGCETGVNNNGGPGGGAGGYAEAFIDVTALAASETVTVGAGGAGSIAGTSAAGGATSFGALVSADGGGGGVVTGQGGVGGSGTVGDVLASGGHGGSTGFGIAATLAGGAGGDSRMGAGGLGRPARAANADGTDGQYGGGGGGGFRRNADSLGGAGGSGIVIVELYA